jgi:Caspase domain
VRKYLLSVGISNYPGRTADLRGCVPDVVTHLAPRLAARGFECKALLDRAGTIANFEHEVVELQKVAVAGDLVVHQHSHHGSRAFDESGDETDDQLDETLCFHPGPRGLWQVVDDYGDDRYGRLLRGYRPGVRVVVFADYCHAGDSTRESAFGNGAPYRKPRAIPPYRSAFRVTRPLSRLWDWARPGAANPTVADHGDPSLVVFAGCQPDQTCADAEFGPGDYAGALTRTFCDSLDANPARSWSEHLVAVHLALDEGGFDQEPRLETYGGAEDRLEEIEL